MARPHSLLALISASGLSLAALIAPPAKAGCGEYKGLMQICFKDSCEVQKLVRHCSSAMSGDHWISEQGYRFGYSRPIGNQYSLLEVIYEPYSQTLYSGDPANSPYTFDVCGSDRNIGGPCSEKSWAKGYR